MGETGSINDKLFYSVSTIAKGRMFLHVPKTESIGLVIFNKGIKQAMQAFKDADASNDLKTILQAQLTFVKQDLLFAQDKYAENTFNASIIDLTDALNASTAHKNNPEYIGANKTYSTRRPTDRVGGFPNDVVHKTLKSEVARLSNSLNSNVMSSKERELTYQRIENRE
jgi:hypothetical protein